MRADAADTTTAMAIGRHRRYSCRRLSPRLRAYGQDSLRHQERRMLQALYV